MKAVNDGEIAVGVIYHYYWYQDQAESGANSSNTKLHFFGNQDPGAFRQRLRRRRARVEQAPRRSAAAGRSS